MDLHVCVLGRSCVVHVWIEHIIYVISSLCTWTNIICFITITKQEWFIYKRKKIELSSTFIHNVSIMNTAPKKQTLCNMFLRNMMIWHYSQITGYSVCFFLLWINVMALLVIYYMIYKHGAFWLIACQSAVNKWIANNFSTAEPRQVRNTFRCMLCNWKVWSLWVSLDWIVLEANKGLQDGRSFYSWIICC